MYCSNNKIIFDDLTLNSIKKHAIKTYPKECCGVLLGTFNEYAKVVNMSLELENIADTNSKHLEYKIDTREILNIDAIASKYKLDIVGFYHSHPDCSSEISIFDIKNSFSIISNVILSVSNSKIIDIASWQISEDKTVTIKEIIQSL